MKEENRLLAYGIALIIILFIVYKFLQKIHLIPTEEDKKAEQLGYSNFWKPFFWKDAASKGKKPKILTKNSAKNLSQKIWDAKGLFNDDEESLYGVFRQIKTQSQISYLSDVFFQETGKDLYEFLNSFLNSDELSKLSDRLNQLPVYTS